MGLLWGWLKGRRDTQKNAEKSLVDEGLTSTQGTTSNHLAPGLVQVAKMRVASTRQSNNDNSALNSTILPGVSVIDFAFVPPATPQLRGMGGAEEVEEIDLGESIVSK